MPSRRATFRALTILAGAAVVALSLLHLQAVAEDVAPDSAALRGFTRIAAPGLTRAEAARRARGDGASGEGLALRRKVGAGAQDEPPLAHDLTPAPTFSTIDGGGLSLEAGHVRLEIDARGAVRFAPLGAAPDGPLGARFSLDSWGRGASVEALPPPGAPLLESASKAVIPRGASLSEVYEPRSIGVEQLFRIASPPEGSGDLSLRARLSGGLVASRPSADAPLALSDAEGRPQLSYGLPVAIDAGGARVACGLDLAPGGALTITIPGAWLESAAWPVVVDPLIGTTQVLTQSATRERRSDAAYSITSDRFVVVWEQENAAGTDRDVFMRRYIPTGTSLPNPIAVDTNPVAVTTTGSPRTASVAWLSGVDRFLVAWVDVAGNRVVGALVDPLAPAASAVTLLPAPIVQAPFTAVSGDPYQAVIRCSVGGRLDGIGWIVAIEAEYSGGSDTDIVAAAVSPAGTAAPVNLIFFTSYQQLGSIFDDVRPVVNKLAAPGQDWVVVLQSDFDAMPDVDGDIFVAQIQPTGVAGGSVAFAGSFAPNALSPSIDGPGPDFVIAYHTVDPVTGDGDVFLERLNSLGPVQGGPSALSVSAAVDARLAAVAFAGSEFSVAWLQAGSATSETGTAVFSRLEGGALAIREAGTSFGTPGRAADVAVVARRGAAVAGKPDYLLAWSEFLPGSTPPGDFDLAIQRAEGTADPVFVMHESSATGEIVPDNGAATGRRNFFRQRPAGGISPPARFFIENSGGLALEVQSITRTNAVDFAVQSPALPISVPPGGAVSFTATFAPAALGVTTGAITVGWGGGGLTNQAFRLNVRGEGVSGTATGATAGFTVIPDAVTNTSGQTVSSVTTSTLVITEPGVVKSIRVLNMTIRHDAVDDLDLILISPTGTRVILASAVGAGGANFIDTSFDDASGNDITTAVAPFSGIFFPQQPLDDLIGEVGTGTWTLEIRDFSQGNAGTLEGWSLELILTTDPILAVFEGTPTSGVALASGAAAVDGRDFGAQALNAATPGSVTITVQNAGFNPLSLTAGPTSNIADFTVVTGAPLTGIAQGASVPFSIRFTPTSLGAKAGQVTFATNDPASAGAFVVNVKGFAFDPALAASLTLPAVSLLPLEIPDGVPAGVSSTIRSPARGQVISVEVTGLTIRHTFVSDLTISLTSPSGVTAVLSDGQGDAEDDILDATFSDAASAPLPNGVAGPFTGAFLPVDALADFSGAAAEGIWTLTVADPFGADDGILESWTLVIRSTDAALDPYMVVRRGSAAGPVLVNRAGGPHELNMGLEVIGAAVPRTETLFVANAGGGTLAVSAPALTAGASAAEFVLSGGALSLGGGASGTYALAFAPTTDGVHDVTLTAAHSGGTATATPFAIRVRGTGVGSVARAAGAGVFPLAIPDGSAAGVSSTAVIAAAGGVVGVTLTVDISHSDVSDVTILLTHGGTTVTLVDQENGTGDDFRSTVFDDGARTSISLAGSPFRGVFRPAAPGSLAAFAGAAASGDWSLTVIDPLAGAAGTLNSWSIEVGVVASPLLDARQGSAAGAVLVSDAAPSGAFAFGDRPATGGVPARATVFIANTGNAPLDLSGLALTGAAGFSLEPAAFASGTLAPAASTTFTAVFDASLVPVGLVNTVVTASALFAHTDTGKPSPFVVRLSGRAVRGVLEVLDGATPLASGAALPFGSQDVVAGPSAPRALTLRNTGGASVVVSAPIASGHAGDFSAEAAASTFPATIPAGATLTVLVRFDPATGGARAATLSFAHDGAGVANPFVISLTGTGSVSAATLRGNTGGGGGGGGGLGCHAHGGPAGADASLPIFAALLAALWVLPRVRRSPSGHG